MNRLRVAFAPYWQSIQHALFPQLECVLGPLTEKQQQSRADPRGHPHRADGPAALRVPGRPPKDRAAMARAFVAKAVYDMPTTRVLRELGHRRGAAAHLRLGRKARCRASRSSHGLRRVLGHAVAPARARSADREHPPRPVGGPPLLRLDGHRSPREAGREGKDAPAAQAQAGTAEEGSDRLKVLASTGRRPCP